MITPIESFLQLANDILSLATHTPNISIGNAEPLLSPTTVSRDSTTQNNTRSKLAATKDESTTNADNLKLSEAKSRGNNFPLSPSPKSDEGKTENVNLSSSQHARNTAINLTGENLETEKISFSSDTSPAHNLRAMNSQNCIIPIAILRERMRERTPDVMPDAIAPLDYQAIAHCEVLADMCDRLATCYYSENMLDASLIFRVLNAHNWTCPVTGIVHSEATPISLSFCFPVHLGGKIAVSNITPRYYPGRYAGEWQIERTETPPTPQHYEPLLAVIGA